MDNFVFGLVIGGVIGAYVVFVVLKADIKAALWEAQNERRLREATSEPSAVPRRTAAQIVEQKPKATTVRRTIRSSWVETKARLENQSDPEQERAARVAKFVEGA